MQEAEYNIRSDQGLIYQSYYIEQFANLNGLIMHKQRKDQSNYV